jgi:predicted nuclease with TOPRIM domain
MQVDPSFLQAMVGVVTVAASVITSRRTSERAAARFEGGIEEWKHSTEGELERVAGEQKEQWEGINGLRKESSKTNERVAKIEGRLDNTRAHAKGAAQ